MSHFDEYREELKKLGLSTKEDLRNLVKPLILETTSFEPNKPGTPPENSQLISHFGGQPYFEAGEKWPTMEDGQPFDFIFQLVNTGDINLPSETKIVQFYYDLENMAWDTADEGWLVKSYSFFSDKEMIVVDKPESLKPRPFCEITFRKTKTLPDWEGISEHNETASNLSCVLNEEEPWENYRKIVEELIGEPEYSSAIGGYPNWVQGGSTPQNSKGKNMPLLFQLDSEGNADLMWGDVGLIYIFHDPENSGHFEFVLQCF